MLVGLRVGQSMYVFIEVAGIVQFGGSNSAEESLGGPIYLLFRRRVQLALMISIGGENMVLEHRASCLIDLQLTAFACA